MTDDVDDAEPVLGGSATTAETRARYAFLKTKRNGPGKKWPPVSKGPSGVTVFKFSQENNYGGA
jgi:hypothetical protein